MFLRFTFIKSSQRSLVCASINGKRRSAFQIFPQIHIKHKQLRIKLFETVFVFDEPTIGLHPLDVESLLHVFRTLVAHGATVIIIEHDLDIIRNADYIIDMGPGGGELGGKIIACGTPADISVCQVSITGKYIQ